MCNSVFVSAACDDECTGLLLNDMDRLYRIITDVTLTTPLPPPYKILYRFENMTEELKVKMASIYIRYFQLIQRAPVSATLSLTLITQSACFHDFQRIQAYKRVIFLHEAVSTCCEKKIISYLQFYK